MFESLARGINNGQSSWGAQPNTHLMSVYYYEPQYLFDRFFENAFGRSQQQVEGANAASVFRPRSVFSQSSFPTRIDSSCRMDLHEDTEKNTVTASFELPGMKKEDVNIDVHDGRLIVFGETKISEEHEENGYAVRERRFGKFSRSLRLPQGVKV